MTNIKIDKTFDDYAKMKSDKTTLEALETAADNTIQNVDEVIAQIAYTDYQTKNPNVDFIDFIKVFQPNNRFASVDSYKKTYADDEELQKKEADQVADAMYQELSARTNLFQAFRNINHKDYKDFIFQNAPRFRDALPSEMLYKRGSQFIKGTDPEDLTKVPIPYTAKELQLLSGSATGNEPGAIQLTSERAAISLAVTEQDANKFLKDSLINKFETLNISLDREDQDILAGPVTNNQGEQVTDLYANLITTNPKTKQLEFYNPKLKKYQPINTTGLEIGDIYSLSGDAIEVVSEVVGESIGYALSKATPTILGKIAAYSVLPGAGAFAGNLGSQLVKVAVGNELFPGLNTDDQGNQIDPFSKVGRDQILSKPGVLSDAAMSGIIGQGGILAEGLVKTILLAKKAGKFRTKDIQGLKGRAKEAQIIADKINSSLDEIRVSHKFNFGMAEGTYDLESLQFLNAMYKSDNDFRDLIDKFDDRNMKALNDFFVKLGDEFSYKELANKGNIDSATTINKINAVLEERKKNIVKRKQEKISQQEQIAGELKSQLPGIETVDSPVFIRTAVGDLQEKIQKRFSRIYQGIGKSAAKQEISVQPIRKAIKTIENLDKKSFVKNDFNIQSLFEIPDDASATFTGEMLINTRQSLRRLLRKTRQGTIDTPIDEKAIKILLKGVNDAIKAPRKGKTGGLHKATLKKLNLTDTEYDIETKKFNETLLDYIKVKNNVPVIGDEDLFRSSFLPGKRYKQKINEVYEVLSQDADFMNSYRNNILSLYKSKVYKDGKFDEKAHNLFFEIDQDGGYGYGVKKFFGEDLNKLKKIGYIEKKVAQENKNLNVLKDKLSNDLDIISINPKDLADKVLNADDPNFSRKLMSLLKNNKEVTDQLKSTLHSKIYDGITDGRGRFDLQKFTNFMEPGNKFSRFNMIKEIYKDTPGYVDGLETIDKAVEIMVRKETAKTGTSSYDVGSALRHLIRARLGMFTPEGRAMTAVIKLSDNAYKKRFAQLLRDPLAVKKLAMLDNIKVPKKFKTLRDVSKFLSTNKVYNATVSQLFFGEFLGIGEETSIDEEAIKKFAPERSILNMANIVPTTEPNVNLFNSTDEMIAPSQQQPQVAQTEAPAPAPVSSGIGALNPQAQAANYAGLFPEDNLGQAIANQGIRRG